MRFWFCISTVALAGVFALTSQADAAWVPQWGAHMNELSGTLMNDFVANRDGQLKGVHVGVPGPAGYGTAYRFDGISWQRGGLPRGSHPWHPERPGQRLDQAERE